MSTSSLHDPTLLMILALLLAGCSGLPLLLRLVRPTTGQRTSVIMVLLATAIGLYAALFMLLGGQSNCYQLITTLPFAPHLLQLDPLSALFSIPVLLVACCCSIYSLGYWSAERHQRTIRRITFFFGLLLASLLWLLMARSSLLFLLGWELMALSAYFLLTSDDLDQEVRAAGTLYLICTHIGTLALFGFFALLSRLSGSYLLPQAASLDGSSPLATGLLLTAMLGFGLKAGIMPLHIWLPSAHANAPSHISAIMSGIILKMGIYGLVRTFSFFHSIPLWWGVVILALGVISAVVGVVFAIGQHDLKRLLAYHSIENIGIIFIGIGCALIGVAQNSGLLILLGLAGGLLHVINHALFKALLFLGAGSVIHASGTRQIDQLGGLLRQMPYTATFFMIGAVAICGLPPLNGFVSELLIYLGLFNGVISGSGAAALALAAPFLALVGGLAVACFVKVFGVAFLGTARTNLTKSAIEAGQTMKLPMAALALFCCLIGLIPILMVVPLQAAVTAWYPNLDTSLQLAALAPFGWLTMLGLLLLVVSVLLYRYLLKDGPQPVAETWGCGYLAPTSRMQYSSSSFAEMLTKLFSQVLRPQTDNPDSGQLIPQHSYFESHVPETVLEQIYLPFLRHANKKLSPLRQLQHGHLHLYILYVLLTLVVLLALPII